MSMLTWTPQAAAKPAAALLVRDVNVMPFTKCGDQICHWSYFGKNLFNSAHGLSPRESFHVVWVPPMSIGEPHAHVPGWEEVWTKLPPYDAFLTLGSEVREMPVNTAFLAPPNAKTVHAVMNLRKDSPQAWLFIGTFIFDQPEYGRDPLVPGKPMKRSADGNGGGDVPRRRVAVTGIGCITPIGVGVDGLWAGLRQRESAVRRIDWFDASPFRSRIAARVFSGAGGAAIHTFSGTSANDGFGLPLAGREDFFRQFGRHDHDAVAVGQHEVAGTDGDLRGDLAVQLHRPLVRFDREPAVHEHGGDEPAERRKPERDDLVRVADAAVRNQPPRLAHPGADAHPAVGCSGRASHAA